MTEDEQKLLLATARGVAAILEEQAAERGDTNNLADEIRALIERVRPKGAA